MAKRRLTHDDDDIVGGISTSPLLLEYWQPDFRCSLTLPHATCNKLRDILTFFA
jgi:hypothetical protein